MEYKIISTNVTLKPNTEELVSLVNQALKEGWKPTGGITCLSIPTRTGNPLLQLCQAVIR